MNIADIAAIVNAGGGGGGGTGGGSAYDFVFSVDTTTSTIVYGLESGDFDQVVAKLKNHEMVIGCQHGFNREFPTSGQNYIFTGADYSEGDHFITTLWRYLSNMSQTLTLIWLPDGTVFED